MAALRFGETTNAPIPLYIIFRPNRAIFVRVYSTSFGAVRRKKKTRLARLPVKSNVGKSPCGRKYRRRFSCRARVDATRSIVSARGSGSPVIYGADPQSLGRRHDDRSRDLSVSPRGNIYARFQSLPVVRGSLTVERPGTSLSEITGRHRNGRSINVTGRRRLSRGKVSPRDFGIGAVRRCVSD